MKLMLMKNGSVKIFQRRFLDVFVEERNADDAFLRRIDILAVDLEIFMRLLAGFAGEHALGHPVEHRPHIGGHGGEPLRVAVSVGIEVIKTHSLHLIVALGIRQRIIRFAKMPLACEESLVARLLQYRTECPFRGRQPTALSLKGDSGHATAVWNASGLHGSPAWRATGLSIEGEERHAFVRHAIQIRCRHAAANAAAVRTRIAVSEVIGDQQNNVWFLPGYWLNARQFRLSLCSFDIYFSFFLCFPSVSAGL
jgi:hypothetical protein